MKQGNHFAALMIPFVLLLSMASATTPAHGQAAAKGDRSASTMKARLDQISKIIGEAGNCEAVGAAIRLGMDVLYGGLRPVISMDLVDETRDADQNIAKREIAFAEVLDRRIQSGKCPDQVPAALDLKIFVEEMNEVALAIGKITEKCGKGSDLHKDPCDQLQPILDEATGHPPDIETLPRKIAAGFSVKLRSPFIPPYTHRWDENVVVTKPLGPGQCVVVFKETKGLMLRLVFARITVVADPWATPQLARGTKIPIWSLRWVPAEYVKEWNICNTGRGIHKTVTQRVKQDIPLTFFWRYYPK